jgi:16S rRNA (uracil1498-N3)-methyltransferase
LSGEGGVPLGGVAARAAAAAQVFVDDPSQPDVHPDDRRHLERVLRLRAGEVVVASDGRGRWCRCRLSDRAGGSGRDGRFWLEPEGPVAVEDPPTPPLTVAFAPAKGDRPEWVVQKLTELGVDRMVPLAADRSVVRWDGDRADRALARLRRVSREAAAQSRRVWLPEVTEVRTVAELVRSIDVGECLALAQLGGDPPAPGTTLLAVGPEGGWSPEELALDLRHVSLGPWVLRSETAAVAAGSILAALRAGTVVGSTGAGCPRPEVGGSR